MMIKAAAVAIGVAVAVSAPAFAAGHKPPPRPPAALGGTQAAPDIVPPPPSAPPAPSLFNVGSLPVRLWAPVQPNYDQRNDRNNNANPVWNGNPL